MKWINFLHFYQPANAEDWIIRESTERSYKRIIKALEENPQIKFTINIAGCLYGRWEELGYEKLIEKISDLNKRGQLELTGTAAYHPFLPLVPGEETERQIKENQKIKQKHFGSDFRSKGFFIPEMAFSENAAQVVKKMGYEWIILDEISKSGRLGEVNLGKKYIDKKSGLAVVFRQRRESNSYVPSTLLAKLKKKNLRTFITATDGELYGHRHEDPEAHFEQLLKNKKLETLTVSQYLNSLKSEEEINLVPSHWNSTEKELEEGNAYSLWSDPKNDLQKKLWQLTKIVYNIVESKKKDVNYTSARWHLVRGMASCTTWWASAKDFRVFGPISWSPDEIEKGVNELTRAVRSLGSPDALKQKVKIEKMSADIKLKVWTVHWKKYWDK